MAGGRGLCFVYFPAEGERVKYVAHTDIEISVPFSFIGHHKSGVQNSEIDWIDTAPVHKTRQ
jgi:hypothetical protein